LILLQGRQVIWSWLQEHPSPISHDYAGCISLPRQLQLGVRRRTPTADAGTTGNTSSPRSSSLYSGSSLPGGPALDVGSPTQQGSTAGIAAAGATGPDALISGSSSGTEADVEYYLKQTPLPELESLRSGRGLRLRGVRLPPGKPW
jgi:hypothetical protein